MRIVITGGGTGGHIFPARAVIEELQRIARESGRTALDIMYIGGKTEVSGISFHDMGIRVRHIRTGKIRRDAPWTIPQNLFLAFAGAIQSLWFLFWYMPDVVFSKGGYGAFPVTAASIVYFIPIMIHESDAVPGIVNYIAGKFARKICIAFEKAREAFPQKKTILTGIPIRTAILGKNRADARRRFGIADNIPVLFICGGSQGSQPINTTVIEILSDLVSHVHIIHQVGEKNLSLMDLEAKEALRQSPYASRYHIFGFLTTEEMGDAYAASDLALCRAGATVITEISVYEKPSILVPLPRAAGDHQRENAYAYARNGAALVLEQANLSPRFLLERLLYIINHPARLQKMAAQARDFAHLNAARTIAELLIEIASR